MIGIKHTKKAQVTHEVRPDFKDERGGVVRRDASDFLLQVEREYERIEGHPPQFDDAYTVRGDEEGLVATWTSPMTRGFPPPYAEAHSLLTDLVAHLTVNKTLSQQDELADRIAGFLGSNR